MTKLQRVWESRKRSAAVREQRTDGIDPASLPAAAPLAEQLRRPLYFFVFAKDFPAHTDSHLFPPLSDPRPHRHLLQVNFTGMLFQSITAQKSQLVHQSSPGRM